MLEVGTMLILVGCLFYSMFNALFFAFVYYRRRRLTIEEGEIFGEPGEIHPPLQVQKGFKQIVPLDKPLTHNAWLHEVAMRHLCTTNKLVGIKETKESLDTRPRLPTKEPPCILPNDILLRIRNLYGPFTDIKLVTRFFHQNRKFDTPVLVYRFDPESAQGEIVDLMIRPSEDLLNASFGQISVKTESALREVYKPKEKKKDQISVVYKHQVSDEVGETEENTCGICFDNYPNAILHPCGHRICVNCHNMLYVKSCPYCRTPIKKCNYELLV